MIEPVDEFINGVTYSTLREQQEKRKKSFALKAGETLDDVCFEVRLWNNPPKELVLPSVTDEGINVFYRPIRQKRYPLN